MAGDACRERLAVESLLEGLTAFVGEASLALLVGKVVPDRRGLLCIKNSYKIALEGFGNILN